jgi:hypothetical protein
MQTMLLVVALKQQSAFVLAHKISGQEQASKLTNVLTNEDMNENTSDKDGKPPSTWKNH